MSGSRKRKNYTPAYRREAAHLVIDTGRPIVQVAGGIGVGEALLGRWVAAERPGPTVRRRCWTSTSAPSPAPNQHHLRQEQSTPNGKDQTLVAC